MFGMADKTTINKEKPFVLPILFFGRGTLKIEMQACCLAFAYWHPHAGLFTRYLFAGSFFWASSRANGGAKLEPTRRWWEEWPSVRRDEQRTLRKKYKTNLKFVNSSDRSKDIAAMKKDSFLETPMHNSVFSNQSDWLVLPFPFRRFFTVSTFFKLMFGLSFSSHSSTAQLNRHDHHHPITTGSAHINRCVCQTCTVAALPAVSIISHRFSFSRFCFFSWNCTLPIFGNCFPSSGAEISRKLSEFARLPTQVVWFFSPGIIQYARIRTVLFFQFDRPDEKKTWSPVKKQKARTVHGQWGWTASFFSTLSRNFQIAKASKKIITTTTNWAEQVANHFAAVVFLPFGAEPFCHVLNSVLFFALLGQKSPQGGKYFKHSHSKRCSFYRFWDLWVVC